MLYLDASALIKRYVRETGSDRLVSHMEKHDQTFTSVISYCEVHATLARKFRLQELPVEEFSRVRENFEWDWRFGLSIVEMELRTLAALPRLVEAYALRAGDAIHLSAATWLKEDSLSQSRSGNFSETFEFGVADQKLAKIAAQCGFGIFNPEQ